MLVIQRLETQRNREPDHNPTAWPIVEGTGRYGNTRLEILPCHYFDFIGGSGTGG